MCRITPAAQARPGCPKRVPHRPPKTSCPFPETSFMTRDATTPSLDFWWTVQGEWAEPPNYRRGGMSGVQRVTLEDGNAYYVKRQHNFLFRSLRYPLGAPTLLREWNNLQTFARLGVPTAPGVAFDMRREADGWHAMLVTRALDGYISLEEGFSCHRWDEPERARILTHVLDALAPLHSASRKHGHLYPKEVFVRPEADTVHVALLDLELSRRHLSRQRAARSDLRRLVNALLDRGLAQSEFELMRDAYARKGMPLPGDFNRH
ncbi:InaA protein [Bordetella genomosp. 1]|uniref:InaA protein n=2 Tax=Bordetella genomosp. 1 TaxID=1395607 RepID=A0A261STU4_9BORD|nr:InaA protein [Bordetella genomosp. 1]